MPRGLNSRCAASSGLSISWGLMQMRISPEVLVSAAWIAATTLSCCRLLRNSRGFIAYQLPLAPPPPQLPPPPGNPHPPHQPVPPPPHQPPPLQPQPDHPLLAHPRPE